MAQGEHAALELPLEFGPRTEGGRATTDLAAELAAFDRFGKRTVCGLTQTRTFEGRPVAVPTFVNEFWTARQRQAHSLHEVSYRACFKPQLPRFFIQRLTQPGHRVYDPFMGRGTTLIEAALMGRVPWGNDINPLSLTLTRPRLRPPTLEAVASRLREIPFTDAQEWPEELLVFYHPETLREIVALKEYLLRRRAEGSFDAVDDWIALVGLNRLTGHSAGFFSVYTLPPNQAVSVQSQRRINQRRQQTPPRRHVPQIILNKSAQLLSDLTPEERRRLEALSAQALLLTRPADATPDIPSESVQLVVTSPPFLDVVQYATDNWLRCWFLGVDAQSVRLTMLSKLEDWQAAMRAVFQELRRLLAPGGHVAFEVGEIHSGQIKLEEAVVPCGLAAGLEPVLVLINQQHFTKTANCWGVANMAQGTNTNRIVLFRKAR